MKAKKMKRILRLLSHLLLWALAAGLLTGWVFNMLTDARREEKITLFAGMRSVRAQELAAALEEDLPEGIRMVQVRPFAYAMMDTTSLETADLYVMTAAQAEEHRGWIRSLPSGMSEAEDALVLDGEPVGVRLFDAASGQGAARSFLNYDESPGEDWYICFGTDGFHLADLPRGKDNAALTVAKRLTELE